MSKLSQKVAGLLDSGLAKHKAGDLVGASEDYDKVLKRSPTQPDALWLRGLVHFQSGSPELAVPMLEKAAKFRRSDPGILNDLGVALDAAGDSERSRQMFEKAVALDPSLAPALVNVARNLLIEGDLESALNFADKAIEAQAFLADAHNSRAIALMRLERFEEALAASATALAHEPENVEFLLNKGTLLYELARFEEAGSALKRVTETADQNTSQWADATMMLGVIDSDAGDLETAISYYNQVIEIYDGHATALLNRGLAYERLGRVQPAMTDFSAALAIDQSCNEASYSLGRLHLSHRQWPEGWVGYEKRWEASSYVSLRRDRGLPLWDGSLSIKQKLLVWGEQGIGDQILFARMLLDLPDKDIDAVAELDPRVIPLMPKLSEKMPVFGYDAIPDDVVLECKVQLPIGSLGGVCRPSSEDFPVPTSYLDVDEKLVAHFKEKYETLAQGRPKVGIAWHSINPSFGESKSLPLKYWVPVLKAADVFFVSVQYGNPKQEIDVMYKETGISIYVDDGFDPVQSLEDAAAQIASLDLVVTTSGTAAHLAGALGKETWVMVPKVPEWRWGISGDKSIWYPDVHIFRQDQPGEWTKVVSDVAEALGARK